MDISFSKAYDVFVAKLDAWVDQLVSMVPNIILASFVFIIGLFIAKLIRKASNSLFSRLFKHQSINKLFTSFIYLAALGVAIFAALSILKLDKAVTSILAGAGLLGLALALAFQDIASNFISGIFMSFRRPLNIGDIVFIHNYLGVVKEVNLRDTVLETFQGHRVIIPNRQVFQDTIENYSMIGKRRLDLFVGVSYGEDLEKVKEVTLNAVKNISVRTDDEILLFYNEFADSSIVFEVQIWINKPDQPVWLQGRSEAIMLIKKAFNEHDITIPFPIRTLDFGIKGGEKLSDMKFPNTNS